MKILNFLAFLLLFTVDLQAKLLPFERADEAISAGFPNVSRSHISIQPLDGGYFHAANFSILVKKQHFHLRLLDAEASSKKLLNEISLMKKAASLKVAPAVHFISSHANAIITDYLPGETLIEDQAKTPRMIHKVANVLKKVHSIKKDAFSEDSFIGSMEEIYAHLKRHLSIRQSAAKAIKIIREHYFKLSSSNRPKVTIHGNLNAENIHIHSKRILLTNWSASLWEDPFYDLSYFALWFNFAPEEEERLLVEYLGHLPSDQDRQDYACMKQMSYACFSLRAFKKAARLLDSQSCCISDAKPVGPLSYYVELLAQDKSFKPDAQFYYEMGQAALKTPMSTFALD